MLGVLTFAVMAWRFWLQHNTNIDVGYRTDTVLDALLIPALLAIVVNSDRYGPSLRRLLTPLCSLVLAAMYIVLSRTRIPFNLAILPLVLLGTSQHPENLVGRILESAPLRWIGRLSYSLYLWQQLFFCDKWWNGPLPLGALQQWPLKLVGLLACASMSYYFLERPMMRLGHRIASSGVPGRDVDQASGAPPPIAHEHQT